MDYIKPLDFVKAKDDHLAKEGIDKNAIIFVAAVKAFPISEEDPYTQRVKLLVQLVVDNHIQTDKLFAIDPDSVQKVSVVQQRKLTNIMKQDFNATTD